MIKTGKPKIVTLAKGLSCTGHMMPISKAVMFEDIPPTEITNAPDATDALTIRYREDVSKGDVIEYGGERWEVLSAFDPYARASVNPRAERSGADMRRKFLKVMVRRA